MVDSIRGHRGTGQLAPSRRSADEGSRSEGVAARGEAEETRRSERDRSEVSGTERLHAQGEMDAMPWGGGDVDSAYSNSCVSSAFVKEWQGQRPDEFRAAAKALRETGEFTVNGQTIKLDDARKATLSEKGMLESDEAVVDAALLGSARAATGKNAAGGLEADGIKYLEDTLQLGVNLVDGADAQVGDYVAVGGTDNKHFVKVVAAGEGGYTLEDAQGTTTKMSKSDLDRKSHVDSSDNLGNWSSYASSASTSGTRPRK